MVSLKKYVACKCGQNNSFDFSSDMAIEDITVTARCSSCGSTIHVSVSAMLSQSPSAPSIASPSEVQQAISEPTDAEVKENVEQAVRDLFR